MANKLPKIKKDLNDFLTQEEGSIDKKNAANLAITAVVLGAAFYGASADAHNSYLLNDVDAGKHSSSDGTHSVPNHASNLLNTEESGLHNSHTSCHASHFSCSHSSHESCHGSCHDDHSSCHCSCAHGSSTDCNCHFSTPDYDSGSPYCDYNDHSNCHCSCDHGSHESCHSSCHTNHSNCSHSNSAT
ncbi:MAG: hypothetical protein PHO58_04355 [Bacilli bacterium]|nr:hypothetical protein [Candidatus Paceibacterota bacterium]MDD4411713.1 hypothetical protein [Bacilli bacterium]